MRKLLFCIPFLFVLISCFPEEPPDGLTVASWNVFLLFDSKDDGDEFPPFDGDNSGVYGKRLRLTEEVLELLDADIIVLEEIENARVLADLIDAGLGHWGFRWYAAADGEGPLSVGFISRIEPVRLAVHSSNGFRPFLDATFRVGNDEVRIFMLHAKSRLGGGERERAALFDHVRWLASSSDAPVLIAGDFNEDPDSGPSFLDRRYGPSVLPVTGDPALTRHDVFYAASLEDPEMVTYAFEGEWMSYDHILLNDLLFDGSRLEFGSSRVFTEPFMLDDDGFPLRFSKDTMSGWSDHLPIVTRLRYNQ